MAISCSPIHSNLFSLARMLYPPISCDGPRGCDISERGVIGLFQGLKCCSASTRWLFYKHMRVWLEVSPLQTRSSKFLNVFTRLNSVYLVSCICRDRRECAKAPHLPRSREILRATQLYYSIELFLEDKDFFGSKRLSHETRST